MNNVMSSGVSWTVKKKGSIMYAVPSSMWCKVFQRSILYNVWLN